MARIPSVLWQRQADSQAKARLASLDFMTPDHHRVRDLAVLGLVHLGHPPAPQWFSEKLRLPLGRTVEILDELEAGMTFLFRGDGHAVTWAYPVTSDRTPHTLSLGSDKRTNAA
jgi:hypothetical protein